jgi:hypothetical protein
VVVEAELGAQHGNGRVGNDRGELAARVRNHLIGDITAHDDRRLAYLLFHVGLLR